MTDAAQVGQEWVPRLGRLDGLAADRAALIRGLFELAAWVADHPALPVPKVRACVVPSHGVRTDECAVVDEVAGELGVSAGLRANGEHYLAEAAFGPVLVTCAARAGEHLAAWHALDTHFTDAQPRNDGPRFDGGWSAVNGAAEQDQAALEAARELYEAQLRTAADALVRAIRAGVTDGAETISHLLATVAANLGGIHTLTAARPGSWEANYVDRFLASTVGADGEWLLEYRTAPIEVVECVEASMGELDIEWLYDDSFNLIDQAEADAVGDDDVVLADAACERLVRAEELINQLRDSDHAAYRQAFEAQVTVAAGELRRTRGLPESVPVRVRWVEWADRGQATGVQDAWGTVEFELWEAARLRTPPPGFTEPLSDIPGPRTPGESLQATGRMPHQRIEELARYAYLTLHTQPESGPANGGEGER